LRYFIINNLEGGIILFDIYRNKRVTCIPFKDGERLAGFRNGDLGQDFLLRYAENEVSKEEFELRLSLMEL
jgi:hypothetical protein